MLITAMFLIIDWLVLSANAYSLLAWHCIYIGGLVLLLWSHSQPQYYDISTSFQKKEKKDINLRECLICHRAKPSRYYHCRRCCKCIFMMDHHCEWVGNCIGQYNSKVYFHLLLNLFVHCLIISCLILYNYDSLLDTSTNTVYFCITLLPYLYALYQSSRLINDFIFSVRNNQSLIESYKKVKGRKWDFKTGLQRHFGSNCYMWPLPFFTNSQCDLLEEIVALPSEIIKERNYADEYLDGSDSEDEAVDIHNQ